MIIESAEEKESWWKSIRHHCDWMIPLMVLTECPMVLLVVSVASVVVPLAVGFGVAFWEAIDQLRQSIQNLALDSANLISSQRVWKEQSLSNRLRLETHDSLITCSVEQSSTCPWRVYQHLYGGYSH
jgi:hypothetical protein